MTEEPKERIWVRNIRKDRKLTVEYVFPIAGTRLRKIITLEKLEQERADGYLIFSAVQLPSKPVN